MKLIYRPTILSLLVVAGMGCQKNVGTAEKKIFADSPVATAIAPGRIDEVSGIADSYTNPGHLWVQQDSGNPADLSLLSSTGEVVRTININGAVNRDWEDLVLAAGPVAGKKYIYLAETGDNAAGYPEYAIYRFEEPQVGATAVNDVVKIRFQYADGAHDAEAIIVNEAKDIYILTKQTSGAKIYKLSFPYNDASLNTALPVGTLALDRIVSAAFSSSTDELLVKTYTTVHYWKLSSNEPIETAINRAPVQLSYQAEPQGEAICFKNDNSGFYTISEKPAGIAAVKLNFYKRN